MLLLESFSQLAEPIPASKLGPSKPPALHWPLRSWPDAMERIPGRVQLITAGWSYLTIAASDGSFLNQASGEARDPLEKAIVHCRHD